jgi:small-conductance mechanosensitive channel
MSAKILIQISLSVGALVLFIIVISLFRRWISSFGKKHSFHERRTFYAKKVITLLFAILFLVFLSVIWGFNIEGLPVYFASFFGIVGIAFFASWSLLSNITASLILFFNYSFRIYDKIKIVDGDNSIIGVVKDMSMFSLELETEEGLKVNIPNNLVIQKSVIILEDSVN